MANDDQAAELARLRELRAAGEQRLSHTQNALNLAEAQLYLLTRVRSLVMHDDPSEEEVEHAVTLYQAANVLAEEMSLLKARSAEFETGDE